MTTDCCSVCVIYMYIRVFIYVGTETKGKENSKRKMTLPSTPNRKRWKYGKNVYNYLLVLSGHYVHIFIYLATETKGKENRRRKTTLPSISNRKWCRDGKNI